MSTGSRCGRCSLSTIPDSSLILNTVSSSRNVVESAMRSSWSLYAARSKKNECSSVFAYAPFMFLKAAKSLSWSRNLLRTVLVLRVVAFFLPGNLRRSIEFCKRIVDAAQDRGLQFVHVDRRVLVPQEHEKQRHDELGLGLDELDKLDQALPEQPVVCGKVRDLRRVDLASFQSADAVELVLNASVRGGRYRGIRRLFCSRRRCLLLLLTHRRREQLGREEGPDLGKVDARRGINRVRDIVANLTWYNPSKWFTAMSLYTVGDLEPPDETNELAFHLDAHLGGQALKTQTHVKEIALAYERHVASLNVLEALVAHEDLECHESQFVGSRPQVGLQAARDR
uniref:Uncharacterized protein n=1 Tax=Globisporangium ultimum (strain ATCC 200006 / CBS 805.95 / DAOM BR144) TaxID=431595 RepID=K3WHG6_GLOUD